MPKRSTLLTTVFMFCIALSAGAQKTVQITNEDLRFCEAKIESMYCFLPTFGLQQFEKLRLPPVVLPGALVLPGFENQLSVVNNLSALMGTELSFLPLSSPASGVTFTFDKTLGIVTPSLDSLGPILTDRYETIGKHRIFVGFLYQHFGFDSFEGHSLKNIFGTGSLATSIDELSVDQYTSYLTYGLTSRVEISAIVPVRQVRLGASGFNADLNVVGGTLVGVGLSPLLGQRREESGVGDIGFRVKGTVYRGERGGVAVGLDLRTPTGDPLNFLGSGAYGVRPFVAASVGRKFGRVYVAPHLNVGFEFNGTSILGGDIVGSGRPVAKAFVVRRRYRSQPNKEVHHHPGLHRRSPVQCAADRCTGSGHVGYVPSDVEIGEPEQRLGWCESQSLGRVAHNRQPDVEREPGRTASETGTYGWGILHLLKWAEEQTQRWRKCVLDSWVRQHAHTHPLHSA